MEGERKKLSAEQRWMHLDITFDDAEHSKNSIKEEVMKVLYMQ